MKELHNESMRNHTSWKIGGPAELVVQPETIQEALDAITAAKKSGKPYYIIGLGSNLLIRDEGLEGTVIKLGGSLNNVTIQGTKVTVEAGTPLPALAFETGKRGLDGLTFASGIPGTVGGALVMNAGAYGGQISDVVVSVQCLTPEGKAVNLPASECGFAYRTSRFKQEPGWIILSAVLELKPGDPDVLLETMRSNNGSRREKQPLEYPCAGSIFQNPPGDTAGRLVEAAGLKGKRVGDALVSAKHANFIVNLGQASCKDVLTLMDQVKDIVEDQSGIRLKEEILILPEKVQ